MSDLRYVLLADGPFDACLTRVLEWAWREHAPDDQRTLVSFIPTRDDLGIDSMRLSERVDAAITTFEPDILFVHRDAERERPENRFAEISEASAEHDVAVVPIVPVRMTEAWLLFNEAAIRHAANNPNGTVSLGLPVLSRVEGLPDPKATLSEALTTASELAGRRRTQFNRSLAGHRRLVASYIDDFSPLRELETFRRFEDAFRNAVPPADEL